MSNLLDLTGMKYGRLTVIGRDDDQIAPSGRRHTMWQCQCSCGNTVSVESSALRRGKTVSCGCAKREALSLRQKIHGEKNTKLYGVWSTMKARCHNKNTAAYKDYGLRGISVCDSWKNDYMEFRRWAYETGYTDGMSIDRINNDLGYCPDNCRWADKRTQANNRRSNRIYTIDGETHNLTEWSNLYGINPKTLFTRIYSGSDFESALKSIAHKEHQTQSNC